ncbi:CLUMA_CG009205, isoform A [Clunio marinus]|uniref:CLUMA_CG009205, isoform A n=1 Tax=Clunio marinus TaxID=568069 RepID=A0A1J1I845_9DIPT|nr:CLUMA_CG009205, isoform A [Clunio marinus]
MLFLNKSMSFVLRSPRINRNFISVLGRNFCSEKIEKPDELKLSYLTGDRQGIAVIELNRENGKNSLNKSLVSKFNNSVDVLGHDKNVRVVIIRSLVKGIFCAGADLKERQTLSPLEVRRFVNSLRQLIVNIENLPMPVIAAIDGAALGGGLELALSCDLRTAASQVKLGLVETRLAIMPGAGGTQRLPRIVSPALAKELIFTARIFSGEEASKMGIVNYSVSQNDSNDAAYQRAIKLAEEILPNGPVGVKMAKRAINKGSQVDLGTGYSIEEDCYSQLIGTKDRLEGLAAFNEKRKPNYIGE